jgi:Na+-transporting NADH:ubiquinone oxidoreductase subunit NqrD
VHADIPPPPPPRFNWLDYGIIVLVGEAVAWLIGAEFLWRTTSKTMKDKQELSKPRVYSLMLLAMVLSFSIGLLFWKALGWI